MLRPRFALLVAVVAVTAHDVTYLVGHGVAGYPAALGATGHDGHWLAVAIGVATLLFGAATVAAARWWWLRRDLAARAGSASRHRIGTDGTSRENRPMQPMRRTAPVLLAGALALLPAVVLAHTELASADPADGSSVSDAPDEIVLAFEGEAGEGSTFVVLDPSGAEVGSGGLDLEVADRNVLRGQVEVAAAGEYTVSWSVVGEDEHPVEGEVTFTYQPEGEASTPDTSLLPGSGSPVVLIGLVLVILAVTMSARRALAVHA